jgi:hypothetical protein
MHAAAQKLHKVLRIIFREKRLIILAAIMAAFYPPPAAGHALFIQVMIDP